jgi:sugar phosphate isomerase/epimerase
VIGEGLNDYDRIFQILSSVGFQGWISIEDGLNGIEEMNESAVFLRHMVSQYF